MKRSEFIATVAPIAVKVRLDGGVLFPSVSIAQMILETGGKIHSWFNLVGYKVGSGRQTPYWRGRSVNRVTWEVHDNVRHDNVSADFRAYDSIEDCLKDQALLFLNNRSRYQRVIDAKSPGEQAEMLQQCGYATDPHYATKIVQIITGDQLLDYDEEAVRAMEKMADLERRLLAAETANQRMEQRLQALEDKHRMAVPEWAQAAIEEAVKAGYINAPDGGSEDFYRFVTVMHRAGMFGGVAE